MSHKSALTRLAPPGTWRGRILQLLATEGAILFREGVFPFLRIVSHRVTTYRTLRTAYARWLQHTTPRGDALARQRAEAQTFPVRPLISLLTPVYNPAPDILRTTLESVLAQTYERWELCLADGASTRPGVRETLAEYAQKDPRIRLQTLPANLGISGNSNAALRMAQGEYIQLLDHDDTLTPDALFEIVQSLNQNPTTDLLYFDEDKLSEDGRIRRGPLFKPGWSPELLLSANFLSHCAIRRGLVLEAGGFDPGMDGAQDWDLAFRVTERTSHIAHLPKVLYNWRQVTGSTAIFADAKTGVFAAQIRAVQSHLHRTGLENAEGTVIPPGTLRFRWPVSGAKVSIILPFSHPPPPARTLSSLLQKTAYPDIELIVNGEMPGETPDPRVQFGNTPATLANAQGTFLLFLHPDLLPLTPDWLEEMVRWAERPEIAVVGAKLISPNRTIQHAGIVFAPHGQPHFVFQGMPETARGAFGPVDWVRNYSAVSGDCLLIRREVFEQIGGFDAENLVDTMELCHRVSQKNYRIVYTPFARLKWSKAPRHTPASLQNKRKPLQTQSNSDPYFNPNLSPSLVPTFQRSDVETFQH